MTKPPPWFQSVVDTPVERGSIVVRGASIETLAWGTPGDSGLLLIHGNGAHAEWWRPFAPFFAQGRRVGAFSLSGMGRSDHRSAYDYDVHREELIAAVGALGLFDGPEKPWIVAHSIAGVPALLEAAGENGRRFGGLILVDSGYVPNPAENPFQARSTWQNPSYATIEEGAARFRLRPKQECHNGWLVDFVARNSLREEADGRWFWRFDATADLSRGLPPDDEVEAAVRSARCPLAFVWGEQSAIMTPAVIAINRQRATRGTPFVEVPAAHHHLMLDQPLAFIAAIRGLLP